MNNDTQNDTRSVFAAMNPLKRRVSFHEMPIIREFERPTSSMATAPSPLPSGFMDTTHTIFNALAPQTPSKLLKVDEQLNQTYVISHTPFHERFNLSEKSGAEMLNDLTRRCGGSSLLFGSQDDFGIDELSATAHSMRIDEEQKFPNKSAAPLSASSIAATSKITDTPKSSLMANKTILVEECVAETPETNAPAPIVQIPMGHLNDAEFEQWHDDELDGAMKELGETVKHYTDKYKCFYETKKRLRAQIAEAKGRIGKFHAEFKEAEQQNGEARRALLSSVEELSKGMA